MKKILITVIIFLLLTIGLSGCINNKDDTDDDQDQNVKIVKWYKGTYWEAGKIMANDFVFNESVKFYMVNGTARNDAGKELKSVIIHVKYYDINNTLLWDDGVLESGIAPNQTWEFVSIYLSSRDHFKDVDHVEFDISKN